MIVAADSSTGLKASRAVVNISRGKVRWSGPARNRVTTTSSSEVAKANNPPEISPGEISGKVTLRRVIQGVAPMLAAAHNRRWFNPPSAEPTLTTTKGTARVVWARTRPGKVRVRPALENTKYMPTPTITAGTIIGAISSTSISRLPGIDGCRSPSAAGPVGSYHLLSALDVKYDYQQGLVAKDEAGLYRSILGRTFGIAAMTTLLCVLLAFPLCVFLDRRTPRTRNILLLMILLPFWTSILVRTYAWLVLLQRQGIINTWLLGLGLIHEPLALVHNFFGTVVGMVHVMLPFLVLPLYDKMKNIDPLLLSAAANCGATPSQAWRQVFLPLSLPGLASGITLVFVLCLGFYLTPALLGGGRVAMWSMKISDTIALYGNWGAASALGVALLVVTVLILLTLRRLFGLNDPRRNG